MRVEHEGDRGVLGQGQAEHAVVERTRPREVGDMDEGDEVERFEHVPILSSITT